MKKFITLLLSAIMLTACGDMYRDEIASLQNQIDDIKLDIVNLNNDISAIQAIVTEIKNGGYITSMDPLLEDGNIIGYTLQFSDGRSVAIRNGKDGRNGENGADGKDGKDGRDGEDGKDGKDGSTPVIGVRQDTDGEWYWTLNGEWLLDANSHKVKATGKDGKTGQDGKDGITPQLRIVNGYWWVSYDNGVSWNNLNIKAVGENGQNGKDGKDGDSFFSSITETDDNVILTLADGTVINIPKASALSIVFDENDLVVIGTGITRDIHYTVSSTLNDITVEAVASGDITVDVVPQTGKSGILRIKTGESITSSTKVVVMVTNGLRVLLKTLKFEAYGIVPVSGGEISVPYSGGYVKLEFMTNIDYDVIVPAEATWISHVKTKASSFADETFDVAANPGAPRIAAIQLRSKDASYSVAWHIFQEGQPGIAYSLPELSPVSVANVSVYNATLMCKVLSNGNAPINACGFFIADHPNVTNEDILIPCDPAHDYMETILNDLQAGTTYYAKAYASNSLGVVYSEETSFTTTNPTPPILSRVSLSNIARTSVDAYAQIVDKGGSDIMQCGFVWSATPYPVIQDHVEYCSVSTNLNKHIINLPVQTTIYVRAFATNAYGTAYSEQAMVEYVPEQASVWDGTIAESFDSGTGASYDPYVIKTAAQLAYLAKIINDKNTSSNYRYKHYVLDVDIDLNGISWTPIGMSGYTFDGFFDGRNNKISGLKISSNNEDLGLFGYIRSTSENGVTSYIRDLTIQGEIHTEADYAGGIAGFNIGFRIINCTSYVDFEYTIGNCHGGIVGYGYPSTIDNCKNYGRISGKDRVGGITGYNVNNCSNCTNYGSVTGHSSVGGVSGYSNGSISMCTNEGKVVGIPLVADYAIKTGGIIGEAYQCNVTQCINKGNVSAQVHVGGIIGAHLSNSNVSQCLNEGKIEGTEGVAGLVGYSHYECRIHNSGNRGFIQCIASGNVGGLVGFKDNSSLEVKNCYQTGVITGGIDARRGGIVGKAESAITMINCCNASSDGLGNAPIIRTHANYWLYDASRNRGKETSGATEYDTIEWFVNDADGAYLMGDKTKDLVKLLNDYVNANGGILWKYEQISGFACPVLDL